MKWISDTFSNVEKETISKGATREKNLFVKGKFKLCLANNIIDELYLTVTK